MEFAEFMGTKLIIDAVFLVTMAIFLFNIYKKEKIAIAKELSFNVSVLKVCQAEYGRDPYPSELCNSLKEIQENNIPVQGYSEVIRKNKSQVTY